MAGGKADLSIFHHSFFFLFFRDLERQRKTKELLSGLGNQEGEFRKMQRKKKRM